MTLSIRDTHPCAECHYAKCRVLFIIMRSVIVLNIVMLRVVSPKCHLVRSRGRFHWKNLTKTIELEILLKNSIKTVSRTTDVNLIKSFFHQWQ